jgi:hypothetical protein
MCMIVMQQCSHIVFCFASDEHSPEFPTSLERMTITHRLTPEARPTAAVIFVDVACRWW